MGAPHSRTTTAASTLLAKAVRLVAQNPALDDAIAVPPALARPQAAVSPRELRLVLIGLMMALTLAALDQNIVATALPRITGDLGGFQHLSWVVTAFIVTSTVSAPLYGRFSDLYGRKAAFTVSIVLFLIGSVACGLAGDLLQLILARALQGLGAGGLIVLAQTVVGDLVSPRERGRYQGLFAAVFAGCSVAGPLVGGLITQYVSWRWIFYVNLPVGAAALALILAFLRPHASGQKPRIDFAGAALLTAGTTCLLFLLTWGGDVYGWLSAPILSLLAATIVSFGALAVVESRVAQPILPPDLFRNRVFVIGAGVIALAAMALFAAVVFLPLMFQLLMNASPASAGLLISPMMGGVIVASFVGGRLVSRPAATSRSPSSGCSSRRRPMPRWRGRRGAPISVLPVEGMLVLMGAGDRLRHAEPDHGDPERRRARRTGRRDRRRRLPSLAGRRGRRRGRRRGAERAPQRLAAVRCRSPEA